MIKKQAVKSCCGSKSYLITLDTAVRKSHIEPLQGHDYVVPKHFAKAGLFFVQRNGLMATSSFGATKINVRLNNNNLEELDAFMKIMEELTSK